MLTPEYLAGLPEPILRLWDDAEREILRDMARRISTYDYWIPAADYQAERLIAAGHTRDEILAVLAKTTRKTEKELRQMMMEAGSRCLREDVAVYQAAGLKTPLIRESKALTEILNSGYRHTLGTMQNITRTTARTATRQFEDALDLAWSQVSSGAFDAGSAIRQAVKQLCQQGVEAVEYPSGHKDTIETAVRRAVLTGVNQTAAKLQEQLADEVGCDLVEVSAHAGARPEHAEWQGKIYSRSGKSEKYPDFRSSTGYGTGAGLCGWNCRHTFGPYIEGSPRIWTDEKLAELNAPKYEYQGEKFTEYEARQKEKNFDRQITRWQREAEAMKAAGQDPAEAQAKVKAWERRKSDFVLNRSELTVAKTENGGIIKLRGDSVTISSIEKPIEQPIEQRNSSRGKPSAITHFDVELNTRQIRLLEHLPGYDSRTVVPKSDVSMTDLSALTARTGDEFAMFTRDNERLLIRGNKRKVNITPDEAKELDRQGYVWSGHTHPGTDFFCLTASPGDVEILKCFKQEQSAIYNSVGEYNIFGKE